MKYNINFNLLSVLGLVFGVLYIISGIIELISFAGVNLIGDNLITGDLFGSFALLTIGAIYMIGFKKSLNKELGAVSYLYTASLLALGIGVVCIMTICSHAVGLYAGVEDYIEWSILEDISIYLILGTLSIMAYYLFIKNIPKLVKTTS